MHSNLTAERNSKGGEEELKKNRDLLRNHCYDASYHVVLVTITSGGLPVQSMCGTR